MPRNLLRLRGVVFVTGRGKLSYIKVFVDLLDAIEPLADDERGRLFSAMLRYGADGSTSELPGNERFLFPMIRAQLDRDRASYEDISAKRSAAGRLGGRGNRRMEAAPAAGSAADGAGGGKGEGKAIAFSDGFGSHDNDNDDDDDDDDEDEDRQKKEYDCLSTTTTTARACTHIEPPSFILAADYFKNVACVDDPAREAEKFIAYNAMRHWDCLPDWRLAADLWAARIDRRDPLIDGAAEFRRRGAT